MSCALNLTTAPTCQLIQSRVNNSRMMCIRSRALISTPFSLTFSPAKHISNFKLTFKPKPYSHSSPSNFSAKMSSSQTIEHIVLFKVKDDTDPSKPTAMIKELNGLNSLDQVVHLTAGAIHKNRSTSFNFTHMLHSRYNSKEALAEYTAHPSHMSVVKESVFPICDDLLAIDWVNSDLNGPLVLKPGSVMRITLLKLKEGLGDAEKNEVLGITKEVKEYFPTIEQISVGENFSPARAKGFSIGSIAIFPGLSEFEAADSNQEIVEAQKVKVRPHLEGVIVLDYVIPSQSASL